MPYSINKLGGKYMNGNIKNYTLYILIGIILLAPYKILGQDNVNGIILGIISVFLLIAIKEIKVNKIYLISLLVMCTCGIISLINTSLTIDSMQGLSLYIGCIILYIILVNFKNQENTILKIVTYVIAASGIFYIIYQGAILKGGILENRIDGNVGYANSYALLMIIAIYFNKIREKDSVKELFDIVFIISILFTGSRNTLLYLGIFLLVDVILNKKEDGKFNLTFGFNIVIAVIGYIFIERIGLLLVLVLPILLIVYYYLINDKNLKVINILTLLSIPVGGIALLITGSNLFERVSAISLESNELQLRIGYLEDVISFVKSNPLGGGINTFMFNQGSFQSGFYDVRYVHNSFGQALYDMGWLGLICFIILFVAGIFVIIKGVNKKKFYYLALYISIYIHSVLDFDFAYLFTFLVLVIIVAFVGNINYAVKLNKKIIFMPVATVGIYITFISTIAYLGEYCFEKGKYDTVITLGEIQEATTVDKDVNGIELQFKGYLGLASIDNNKEKIEAGINILEERAGYENRTSYIYYDLAVSYRELGNKEKASYYYEKVLEKQKYNLNMYKEYCDLYSDNETRQKEIMEIYNEINNNRSEKSKERFKE